MEEQQILQAKEGRVHGGRQGEQGSQSAQKHLQINSAERYPRLTEERKIL